LEERDDALVVPQAAVVESQGSASLFVVKPDQTVEARPVKMGPRAGPLWVVEDGVEAGEHVVVKGLQQIRPGAKVEPSVEAFPVDAPEPAPGPPARPRPRT
ncbi:MAG: HlyD family secretion protein, partial [Candidatus Rokuibacteriota bacterium]